MENLIDKNNLPNKSGFTLDHKLPYDELNFFKEEINKQWLQIIEVNNPSLYSEILRKNIKIFDYHKISKELDHSKIWKKSNRILPSYFSDWFMNSVFAHELRKEYGEYIISDEDNLGRPNIYWRLVRPNQKSDVGPIHRDSWFWELNKDFPKPSFKFHRLKVWISIYVEKGLNGLKVEPKSQIRNDIVWNGEKRDGIKKPLLLTPMDQINTILLKTSPGQAVVFNDDLLHGGSVNSGKFCRVSVEFTMLIES